MDFHDLKEDNRRLSIVEPVYVTNYGKSTSPFYLTDQQHLVTLHQPDHRIIYLASLSNSSLHEPADRQLSVHQLLAYQPNIVFSSSESLNEPTKLSERQSEVQGRPFFKVLSDKISDNFSDKINRISKSFSSIKSVYNTTIQLSRLDRSEQLNGRKVDDPSVQEKRSALNRVVDRLGKLISLPKRANEQASDKSVDSNNVNILRPSSDARQIVDSPAEYAIETAPKRGRLLKETYKAFFKTELNPLAMLSESAANRELNRIYSLASFVERNLRIIGLQPIYQLLSFNRTSSLEDENLKKLVKQIDSKLVQSGEFGSLFSHFSSMKKTNDPRSINRKSMDQTEDLDNSSDKPTSNLRSDELNEIDLLLELEEYVRSKRSTALKRSITKSTTAKSRTKQKTRKSSRHEDSISRENEGVGIRREDNSEDNVEDGVEDNAAIEQDRPMTKKKSKKSKKKAEKRSGLAVKSRAKSRKRRSKKLGLKNKKSSRRKSGRSQKRLKSKFKKSRSSKKKKKSKGYNQSFPACDSTSESCRESAINERYVPFTTEEDDGQASESGQRQANESEQSNGNQHNVYSRDGNEYAGNEYGRHQTDQQPDDHSERLYEPATDNFRQDGEFRTEFGPGGLKSSVKYDQANHQTNYGSQSYDSGGQSNYQSNYQQLAEDDYKQQTGEDDEYGQKSAYSGNSNYNNAMFETDDGLSYSTANKPISPYPAPEYVYQTSSWSISPPHDTKSLLKSLLNLKLKKKHPPPVYHHHHLDHWPGDDHHYEHLEEVPPLSLPPPHDLHHEKDELALVKELITNLLVENKHKILKILKISKLSHLLAGKQLLAVVLKILFGKGVIAKKHLILVAYKKCYIKIKTVDLLLIPGMQLIRN